MYPNLTDWFIRSEYQMARNDSKFLTATELAKIADVLAQINSGDRWACTPLMRREVARMLSVQMLGLAAEHGAGAA